MMIWADYIPAEIQELYEVHEVHHASAILANEFPSEFSELCSSLLQFRLHEEHVKESGGNESKIPKIFSKILRPLGWKEGSLSAKLIVDDEEMKHDTHKIDYIKNRVAFDLEWNSKDQTFDRDLYAFRTFFEYGKISVGVLVTRSKELNPWFASLGEYTNKHGERRKYKDKYGESTTHMGKLLTRLQSGRNGGCPVLALGITTGLVVREDDDGK